MANTVAFTVESEGRRCCIWHRTRSGLVAEQGRGGTGAEMPGWRDANAWGGLIRMLHTGPRFALKCISRRSELEYPHDSPISLIGEC